MGASTTFQHRRFEVALDVYRRQSPLARGQALRRYHTLSAQRASDTLSSYYAYDSPAKVWYWYSRADDQLHGPYSTEDLHVKAADGEIDDDTIVMHQALPKHQFEYDLLKRHKTKFTFRLDDFVASRQSRAVTVLSGPNNCGKSLLLKALYYEIGHFAYFLPCDRISNLTDLAYSDLGDPRILYTNFSQGFLRESQNTEKSHAQLKQIITSLGDDQRNRLFQLANDLIGMEFTVELTDPDNSDFSPRYVAVDGEPLVFSPDFPYELMFW
jgi:hypothetical protein